MIESKIHTFSPNPLETLQNSKGLNSHILGYFQTFHFK
ncbi:hypothetical protein HC081234_04780 [Helicobacter cinaedi]|nr:hypothetical protein HC081234_04780 [Helicobacter cinaedi]